MTRAGSSAHVARTPLLVACVCVCASAMLLGGCPDESGSNTECTLDTECGGDICARDGTCTPASTVRQVTVTWTVDGAQASMLSCQPHPDLSIEFRADVGDTIGYAPVPCNAGQYNIDKLPKRYVTVELAIDNTSTGTTKAISTAGSAAFDLRF